MAPCLLTTLLGKLLEMPILGGALALDLRSTNLCLGKLSSLELENL